MYYVLQGSTLPTSECSDATVNIYSPNDTCSRGVQYLFNDNDDAIGYLFNGDCPTRFHEYITACNDVFNSDEVNIIDL